MFVLCFNQILISSILKNIKNIFIITILQGAEKEVVINTEWGALGNTGSLDFIRTQYDHQVDVESKNRGKQVYEKLIR